MDNEKKNSVKSDKTQKNISENKQKKTKKPNGFGAKAGYYVKDSLFLYSYILVGGFIGAALMYMQKTDIIKNYVAAIFAVINAALYCVVARNIFYKTGEDGAVSKHANDVERRHMIETDNYFELDKTKEYDIKKAIIFAVIGILPQVSLLIIKTVGTIFSGNFTVLDGGIRFLCGIIYPVFYAFDETVSAFFGAFAIIIIVVPVILGYYLGAKKAFKVYEKAEKLKEEFGDSGK